MKNFSTKICATIVLCWFIGISGASAQEALSADTTWFTIEQDSLSRALNSGQLQLSIPYTNYEQSFFSGLGWTAPQYVFNNDLLNNFFHQHADLTDTGIVYNRVSDTVVQEYHPIRPDSPLYVTIHTTYKCTRHLMSTVHNGGIGFAHPVVWQIQQFTVAHTDLDGYAYFKVNYFLTADSSNKVSSSVKYITYGHFYDSTADKIYGFVNHIKAYEGSSPFSKLAEQNNTDQFRIYPNPASGNINILIKVSSDGIPADLHITDIPGTTVREMKTPPLAKNIEYTFSYPARGLAPGSYFIHMEHGVTRTVQKLMIVE